MSEKRSLPISEAMSLIWAKSNPLHPLYCHLIDVGWVSHELLNSSAFESVVPRFALASGVEESQVVMWLSYFSAMHDIGKCDSRFQLYGPDNLAVCVCGLGLPRAPHLQKFYHNAMSALWMIDYLKDELGWPRKEAATVSACLRGHHGDLKAEGPECEPDFVKEMWEPLRREVELAVRSVFHPELRAPAFADHSVVGTILLGILTWSDWVASNSEIFPIADASSDLETYAELSLGRARTAVRKLGFCTPEPVRFGRFFTDVWPKFNEPWPIQTEIECLYNGGVLSRPGLVIIEAPMGEGKTEAALYLALQWIRSGDAGGLYMALPTTATSNQMYRRVNELLQSLGLVHEQGVKLVHGMAWLVDGETAEGRPKLENVPEGEADHAADWFRPSKRALLATYGVGTVDQAMGGVLHVRHSYLKLFGLAGKVLIVDEIHAYDAYMSEIIERLLSWCGAIGIPVVLLSATLPSAKRFSLIQSYGAHAPSPKTQDANAPYPLITYVSRDGVCTEHAVPKSSRSSNPELIKHWEVLEQPKKTADLVLSRLENGGCFCVIANTVNSAQKIYDELKRELEGHNDCELDLFHARFPAWRRQEIEDKATSMFGKGSLLSRGDPGWTERPDCAILVATQVVEQSLDLDFDEMFTEIAPVDLLLQRIGRLHRHKRPCRPTGSRARCHVLLPDAADACQFGASRYVYHPFLLLKTLSVLIGRDTIFLPDDIRPLVELVYDGSDSLHCPALGVDAERVHDLWQDLEERLSQEPCKADRYLIPHPSQDDFMLARIATGSFDTDDGDVQSYFAVRTRNGDETRRLLVLEGDDFAEEMMASSAPARDVLKEIAKHGVDVPKWWLQGVSAVADYAEIAKAPAWLPGMWVLRTRCGVWRGLNARGDEFAIANDNERGLSRTEWR